MSNTVKQLLSSLGLAIPRSLQVASGTTIYEGRLVGLSSGKAIVADSTHAVIGVAINTKGGGYIVSVNFNHVIEMSLPGVVATDWGSTVFAADDVTLTLTTNLAVVGQIIGVNTSKETVYVHMTLDGLNGAGAVDTVFGRTGDVVAAASDYAGSQIVNDSGVAGTFVDEALDNLAAAIPVVPVSSVFTRTGAVVAAASDYDASQVDNDSTFVTGAPFVNNALDKLHNTETYITKDANYNILPHDNAIGGDTIGGPFALTLPDAASNPGVRIRASKISSDSNILTIATTGGDTIGFQSQWSLTAQGDSLTAISDGVSEWLMFTERHASDNKFFKLDPNANLGNHRVRSLASTGNINMEFRIPDNFLSLISLVIEGNPSSGAAGSGKDIDLFSDYGGLGENYAAHSESDTTTVYDFTGLADAFMNIDLSGVFTSISAGDRCGLNIDHNGIGGAIRYTGITLIYLKKG